MCITNTLDIDGAIAHNPDFVQNSNTTNDDMDEVAVKSENNTEIKQDYDDNISNSSEDIEPPDELMLTIRKLNKQSSVVEENEEQIKLSKESLTFTKRKSPTNLKQRIKSPYENKSLALEEKKRKRLLEIRERREKRKNILSESCKMNKNKYGKGCIQPQASSSVTKLSITNKAFYKSIFGDTSESGSSKSRLESCPKASKKKNVIETINRTKNISNVDKHCIRETISTQVHEYDTNNSSSSLRSNKNMSILNCDFDNEIDSPHKNILR